MKRILLKCILVFGLITCIGCSEHKHKYGEWIIDETGHYHSFICDECAQPTVMEPHKDLNYDNKCDECNYYMGTEHLFKWVGTLEGHHKTALCGCCNYPEVYSHMDNDKDNLCDICKYSMIDIEISWMFTETHHWYQFGDETVVFEYGVHVDENNDCICDLCKYFVKETNEKTTWVYEDGTEIFSYDFSVGDTYRFEDRNIYVNDTLVFTIDDLCNHHYYEYNIGSTTISTGIYEEFIETIIVKKITIDYYIEVYRLTPYNEYPTKLPFNCDLASLGMKYLTPGEFSTHRCVGVYFDEKFENEVFDPYEVLEMENKVLYVKWEKIPIFITLDLNSEITDGVEALLDDEDKIIEKLYDEDITLPVPSISGFEFIGWYDGTKRVTDNQGQLFWDINILDDINLKAKWIRTEYYFNVKQIYIDNVLTNVLEIGKGANKTEHIIPENALSNNSLVVLFIKEVMEELYEDALHSENIHADYYNPGYHLEFFTSTLNDVNTRTYWVDLEEKGEGFYLCPYYEKNENVLEVYDGEKYIYVTIDYESALNKYKLAEPLFEKILDKEGYLLCGVCAYDGNFILDYNYVLCSAGLERLELRYNKTHISGIAEYINYAN